MALRQYQEEYDVVPYSPSGGDAALQLLVQTEVLTTDRWFENVAYLNPKDLKIPESKPRVLLMERSDRSYKGRLYYVDTGDRTGMVRARGNKLKLGDPSPAVDVEPGRNLRANMSMIRAAINQYQNDYGAVPYSPLGGDEALHLLVRTGSLETEEFLDNVAYLNPKDLKIPEPRNRILLIERSDRSYRGHLFYVDTRYRIGTVRARGNKLTVGDPSPLAD